MRLTRRPRIDLRPLDVEPFGPRLKTSRTKYCGLRFTARNMLPRYSPIMPITSS